MKMILSMITILILNSFAVAGESDSVAIVIKKYETRTLDIHKGFSKSAMYDCINAEFREHVDGPEYFIKTTKVDYPVWRIIASACYWCNEKKVSKVTESFTGPTDDGTCCNDKSIEYDKFGFDLENNKVPVGMNNNYELVYNYVCNH